MSEFSFFGAGMKFQDSKYPFFEGAAVIGPDGQIAKGEMSPCEYDVLVTRIKRFKNQKGIMQWVLEGCILAANSATAICQLGQTYALGIKEEPQFGEPQIASLVAAFSGRSEVDFALVPEPDRIGFVKWLVSETASKGSAAAAAQRVIKLTVMPRFIMEGPRGAKVAVVDPTTGKKKLGIPNYNFAPVGGHLPIQPGGTPVLSGVAPVAVPVATPAPAPVTQVSAPAAVAPVMAPVPTMTAVATPPAMAPVMAPPPPPAPVMTPPPPPPAPAVVVVWGADAQWLNPVTGQRYYAGNGSAAGATHILLDNSWANYNPAIHPAPDANR